MSSPVLLHSRDDAARQRALDPTRSFTVQAPAGSGKTELLIQRYLGLLAAVTRPESIVAITFTRKAAGEMMQRVMDALRQAEAGSPVEKPHLALTRDLALRALSRDRELKWNLLEHPGRLRVQTIDSLCMSIAGEMPWLARLGGVPRIEEDATQLYEEAANQALRDESPDYEAALTAVLRHLDNNATQARQLIATMLGKRDQWMPLLKLDAAGERDNLEEALERVITRELEKADALIPETLRGDWLESARFSGKKLGAIPVERWPAAQANQIEQWRRLTDTVLTRGGWRQRGGLRIDCGFPPGSNREKDACASLIAALQEQEGLLEALQAIRKLPPPQLANEEWEVLRALLRTLQLAAAELKVTFQQHNAIDFIELGSAALGALGDYDGPSDLAFRLDSRIEHLLVDEFQDTSRMQFELLRKLTAEWAPDDGRTLFIVGDPMQSIYRFRQAEVGLFLEVEQNGMGNLRPEPLQLRLNRRSQPAIVHRVNELLKDSFPAANDAGTGATVYTPSIAARQEGGEGEEGEKKEGGGVTFDGFLEGDDSLEAACVIRRIQDARKDDPDGSIAILVRARTHLSAITETLKLAAVPYQAVEIEPLEGRTVVRDLLALTRALLNPADRVAWLAILRAPWCGLALGDLEALVRGRPSSATAEEYLADISGLSPDGRLRAARVRNILGEALAEQGRWPLRRWVERTWIRLGGPAALNRDEGALEEALAYLDRVESEQSGTGMPDFDQFSKEMANFYARPRNSSTADLQVMTIHKAKGLEFDTVIVPGLGRQPKIDDSPLVLFHEWRYHNDFECLLAPINETGGEKSGLYQYLRGLERRKSDWERTRQLYVAATRAKKRLHLLGQVALDGNGNPRVAYSSMLADFWAKLTAEEQSSYQRGSIPKAGESTAIPRRQLHRLSVNWELPELPAPVAWAGADPVRGEPHEPSFEWVGDTLRHTGTVVHALLQKMPARPDTQPTGLPAIRKALAHAGVLPGEIESSAQIAQQAIARTLRSPRGQWILEPHAEAASEYAVTGLSDGKTVSGLIDRTFVEDGVRWIVDFKTSAHQGGSLESFLDEQQRRYRDQMDRYARILSPLGNPVRLGLYFPLLDAWREWAPEAP